MAEKESYSLSIGLLVIGVILLILGLYLQFNTSSNNYMYCYIASGIVLGVWCHSLLRS